MSQSVDPVGAGFVTSLRRPGDNVTGINLQFDETAAKRLQPLREMRPKLTRVAFLWYAGSGVKAPGITVPQTLRLQAERVIE